MFAVLASFARLQANQLEQSQVTVLVKVVDTPFTVIVALAVQELTFKSDVISLRLLFSISCNFINSMDLIGWLPLFAIATIVKSRATKEIKYFFIS